MRPLIKNSGTQEFFIMVGIFAFLICFVFFAIFVAIFAYSFLGARWLVLNTLFRHKIYLSCYGKCDPDIIHKLNWLKKHYRWCHAIEYDTVEIAEYQEIYESTHICGIVIRFIKRKHAVHFKLASYH